MQHANGQRKFQMNYFVIMPFATEFDDVYEVIKATVEMATADIGGRCFRLDESRPAGRITDRLLMELKSATVCIADLTESKPNVMWELGFAMALQKPTIIITQDIAALPFDIKDMQAIEYSRSRLNATLTAPLKRSFLDTLAAAQDQGESSSEAKILTENTMATMLNELSQLKSIVSEIVNSWKTNESKEPGGDRELHPLEGHWINAETGSHIYSRIVHGKLISPYCYEGNNELTGAYFGWRRIGEHWFARYQWIDAVVSGFTFLRMDSLKIMRGAWWSSKEELEDPGAPPKRKGIPATWKKIDGDSEPDWVKEFFLKLEKEGIKRYTA